jgi:hypothetical protein
MVIHSEQDLRANEALARITDLVMASPPGTLLSGCLLKQLVARGYRIRQKERSW